MKDKTLSNEQYKYLGTNVKFTGDGIKFTVVTPGYFGEGKTFVAVNLTKNFALSNHKVVIVNMNLRRLSLRSSYDIGTEISTTNVVVNKIDFSLAISHDESIWDLDIICTKAVPPDANKLVSSDSMKNFIRILEANYDYVIIDTLPTEAYSGAAILPVICDVTLLVYEVGETKESDTEESIDSVRNASDNLVGLARINKKWLQVS